MTWPSISLREYFKLKFPSHENGTDLGNRKYSLVPTNQPNTNNCAQTKWSMFVNNKQYIKGDETHLGVYVN